MSTRPTLGGTPGFWYMLGSMLRKERIAFTPRDRFFVLGVFALASLQTLRVDELFFFLGLALGVALFIYLPVIEWYQETDPMLHSLPVRRDIVVLARYLVAIVAGGGAGIIWSATGHLLLPILAAGRETPSLFMTFEGGLTFLLAFALVAILFLPMYFGWGLVRGGLAFLGSCGVLFPLAYATAGLGWGPGGVGSPSLIPPSRLISARVGALIAGLGSAGALTVILLGLAGGFWISIMLSQTLFRKREL